MRTKIWIVVFLLEMLGGIGLISLNPVQAKDLKVGNIQEEVKITKGSLDNVECLKQKSNDLQSKTLHIRIQRGNLEDVKCLQKVVKALIDKGESKAAIPFADLALELFEKDFPDKRKEISISRRHRAFLYEAQGEEKKAESLYWDALDILDVLGFQTTNEVISKSEKSDNTAKAKTLLQPPRFKEKLEKLEFKSVLIIGKRNISQALPSGGSLNQEITRLVGLPKEDDEHQITVVLYQLASLYYRQEQYTTSAFILENLLENQSGLNIPGKNLRVVNQREKFSFLALLVKNYLALNQTKKLDMLNLSNIMGSEYASLLRITDLQDALNNRTVNNLGFLTTTIDAATVEPLLSIIHSTISYAVKTNKESLDNTQRIYLNRIAFLNNLLYKGRSIAIQNEFLYKSCRITTEIKVRELCSELINDVYGNLSSFIYKTHGQTLSNDYNHLEEKRRDLERQIKLSVAGSTFPEILAKKPIENLQAQIPKNAALVEIVRYLSVKAKPTVEQWWDEWRYAATVLNSTGEPQWIDLGKADEIDQFVKEFRKALADRGEISTVARKLNRQVMEKIRPLLGNAKHLLIAADGQLNLIPFEALQDETGQYLINRDYQFSYLTSGRDLIQMADSRKNPYKSRQDTIILADPNYYAQNTQIATSPSKNPARKVTKLSKNLSGTGTSVDTLGDFSPAPGTPELAGTLKAQIFPTATVLSGEKASKTALKQLRSPQILLIGTHGFFLSDSEKILDRYDPLKGEQSQRITILNPLLLSGLALAGFNRRNDEAAPLNADNGVLTALEVAGLDLRGTQLVVLSACETGLGEPKIGDGVYGLRRALAIAGSETQVLSLWKVDGEATKDLMVDYFGKLSPKVGQGMGRHEALQAAKQELMKNPKYQHPYYWAGFISSGDWTPLH